MDQSPAGTKNPFYRGGGEGEMTGSGILKHLKSQSLLTVFLIFFVQPRTPMVASNMEERGGNNSNLKVPQLPTRDVMNISNSHFYESFCVGARLYI